MSRVGIFLIFFVMTIPVYGYGNNFTFQNLGGDLIEMSDFQGKHILVEGMTTWCESCKAEIDQLKEVLHATGDNLKIISISLDLETDSFEKLSEYKMYYNISWDIYQDHTQQFTNFYSISNYPALFFYDELGEIIHTWDGYTPGEVLIDTIEEHVELVNDYQSRDLDVLVNHLKSNLAFKIFGGSLVLGAVVYVVLRVIRIVKPEN